ncbi:MAG: sulfurtransferase [Phycisphaerae bacterium]
MSIFVNIAAYKFADMKDLPALRARLRERCDLLSLKGTVLLSDEGINLFVAGDRLSIDAFLKDVRSIPGLDDLEAKESFSDHQPFSRMLVKLKKEIIPFGVEGIDPRVSTSPRLSAKELKTWLDEGRAVTLLDVRNNFEFDLGTFHGAVPIDVDDFRRFSVAAKELPEAMKSQPVVTFCTGGIRCEKAAPLLEREGFEEVYQLDGGILKYFEEVGGTHYDGECFVFDKRVALDSELNETETSQCYACQATLQADDRESDQYVEGVCCPYCQDKSKQTMIGRIAKRHRGLASLLEDHLPGAKPYTLERPVHVTGKFDGARAIDFLNSLMTRLSENEWLNICANGDLVANGSPIAAEDVVRAGQRLVHLVRDYTEPAVSSDITILYEDEVMVVVNKPAPLPMHACGRFHRNSLMWIMNKLYYPEFLRSAHRLDANTTGVVVLSRSKQWAREIQPLFEKGRVEKRYICRVRGAPTETRFTCTGSITAEPEKTGARGIDPEGLPSRTEIRLVECLDDGTSIVEAVPLSGRTNQIRIHLWDAGFPVMGDPLYLPHGKRAADLLPPDEARNAVATLSPDDPPMCLHAASVTFDHPKLNQAMTFSAPLPSWVPSHLRHSLEQLS